VGGGDSIDGILPSALKGGGGRERSSRSSGLSMRSLGVGGGKLDRRADSGVTEEICWEERVTAQGLIWATEGLVRGEGTRRG